MTTYSITVDMDDDQSVIIHDTSLVAAQEALAAFRNGRFAPVMITTDKGKIIPEETFRGMKP